MVYRYIDARDDLAADTCITSDQKNSIQSYRYKNNQNQLPRQPQNF